MKNPRDQQPGAMDELTRLRWGVAANAGRLSSERTWRWSHVRRATGLGSTRAQELCVAAGFDPDELVGGDDQQQPSPTASTFPPKTLPAGTQATGTDDDFRPLPKDAAPSPTAGTGATCDLVARREIADRPAVRPTPIHRGACGEPAARPCATQGNGIRVRRYHVRLPGQCSRAQL
jgi:hypothetical protein